MTQIIQKRKKSLWVWVILLLILIGIIAVIVLSNLTNPDTGKAYIDLIPVANYWMGVFYWAVGGWTPEDAAMKTADPTYVFNYQIINSVLLFAGAFFLGIIAFYIIKKYFIGEKVTTTATGSYIPQGQTIPASNSSKDETVIS